MPRYNLNNNYKAQLAREYFEKLILDKAIIELKKILPVRTSQQNRLYWLWLTCIERETGHDRNECHYLYRAKFLQKDEEEILAMIRQDIWEKIKEMIINFQYFKELSEIINFISYHTPKQDTKQFTHYLNKIKDHALTNMNILLLNLEEKNFQDFYNEYIQFV